MYQIMVKSPAWEIEKVNDSIVLFSSRNSGCASFIAIPANVLHNPSRQLKKGILIKCDFDDRFVEILDDYDMNLSLHG